MKIVPSEEKVVIDFFDRFLQETNPEYHAYDARWPYKGKDLAHALSGNSDWASTQRSIGEPDALKEAIAKAVGGNPKPHTDGIPFTHDGKNYLLWVEGNEYYEDSLNLYLLVSIDNIRPILGEGDTLLHCRLGKKPVEKADA